MTTPLSFQRSFTFTRNFGATLTDCSSLVTAGAVQKVDEVLACGDGHGRVDPDCYCRVHLRIGGS